jgi:hypothetical protein
MKQAGPTVSGRHCTGTDIALSIAINHEARSEHLGISLAKHGSLFNKLIETEPALSALELTILSSSSVYIFSDS